MPETPQPQPGPSPTPPPQPCGAVIIKDIIPETEGAIIVPESEWLPSFFVSQDYMNECEPEIGGAFVDFGKESVVSFMSATDYTERYG